MSLCLFVCLSVCLSFCLYTVPACLSVCLSVCLLACLIFLSVHLLFTPLTKAWPVMKYSHFPSLPSSLTSDPFIDGAIKGPLLLLEDLLRGSASHVCRYNDRRKRDNKNRNDDRRETCVRRRSFGPLSSFMAPVKLRDSKTGRKLFWVVNLGDFKARFPWSILSLWKVSCCRSQ